MATISEQIQELEQKIADAETESAELSTSLYGADNWQEYFRTNCNQNSSAPGVFGGKTCLEISNLITTRKSKIVTNANNIKIWKNQINGLMKDPTFIKEEADAEAKRKNIRYIVITIIVIVLIVVGFWIYRKYIKKT